jgi:hypothetical protein
LVDQFQTIERYVQQCDGGAKTGRINALYSMPWLVGLIDCRDDAEGGLAISALSYLNGSSIHRDQDTENESDKATEEERNIRRAISF